MGYEKDEEVKRFVPDSGDTESSLKMKAMSKEKFYTQITLPNNFKPANFSEERWGKHKEASRLWGWCGGFRYDSETKEYYKINGRKLGG